MQNLIEASERERSTIGVILDRELRTRLEQAAAEHERSVGAEVRVALRRHLARDDEMEEA
jgi:plasmid stability protein